MAKAYTSAVIEASAEQVWQAVRDFNGLPSWHPAIEASELDNGGAADAVGSVRQLALAGGGTVRERLVALDDVERSLSYVFVESPFPVRSYHSTIRVAPVTGTGQSFVEWFANFDADAADEEKLTGTFADGVYRTGLEGLRAYLAG